MTHEEMLIYLDAKMKDLNDRLTKIEDLYNNINDRLKRLEEDESFMSILKKIEEDKDG